MHHVCCVVFANVNNICLTTDNCVSDIACFVIPAVRYLIMNYLQISL